MLWIFREVREKLLIEDPSIDGFNVGINVGAAAGQTIMHAHLHLIPRRLGDTPQPRGGVRGVIPGRMSTDVRTTTSPGRIVPRLAHALPSSAAS